MILHGFFRSTASWRVRIALGLKGVQVEHRSYMLRKGEHRAPAYLEHNPQGLVPSLELDDGRWLTQSLAIIEYLDEVFPETPLLPSEPFERAKVRSLAQIIACDVHPVQNLKILYRVAHLAGEEASRVWARETIEEGLAAFAMLISESSGPFSSGNTISLADVCLIPQLANARRFGARIDFGRIGSIEKACLELSAFQEAIPEAQGDAL